MASFNTIWSIDLGKSSLKAVKLRREKNNVEILAIDKIDYPMGNNGMDTVQQAREALNAFKVRNDVREPVVVAHPGQGTFSRFIKVPAFEAKKLKEMVGYEASQQIPFPLDEVIWDYHLVSREYLPGEEREVGIFAVRKEAIDDYLLDFTSEGLSVEVLSIGYLGLLNYIFFDIAPQEPSIVVDIGATHTDLILVDGKKFWIRALPHSGNDINKAIMDRFKVSFQEAEKLKIDSAKAPQQAVKIFSAVIQPKLKDLVGEIHRSTGYYRSQVGEVKFQHLYLLGNGSKIVGIRKYLQEQLGVQVHRVQTLRHFRVNRDVDLKLLQNELPAFGTAFGCALQGVGAGNCRVDLVPQEERAQKDLRRKKKHAFIAMGIVYLAILLGYWVLSGRIERAQNLIKENNSQLKTAFKQWESKGKTAGGMSLEDKQKKGAQLQGIAEVRALVLASLRTIGSMVPSDNEKTVHQIVDEKLKGASETKAKEDLAELNKKKLWIPGFQIERIDWPEGEIIGAGRRDEKKKVPTVAAYKLTIVPAVVAQATPEESLALIQKLFVDPLRAKMKESPELTMDPEVKISPEFIPMNRLSWQPAKGKGAQGANVNVAPRHGSDSNDPQEAGPFLGTEVYCILRLREPKEEAPEPVKVDEEKPGKGPVKRPPKKSS